MNPKKLLTLLPAIVMAGCSSTMVSSVLEKTSGNQPLATIVGASVGGNAGGEINKRMDKQADQLKTQVPNATVTRVGEGIEIELPSSILFAVNRSDLNPGSAESLRQLAGILSSNPDTNVEVQGHTDNTGSASVNQQLSARRAASVASWLRSNGVASSRITTRAYGATAPKYPNDTETGRAGNRRVEFLVTANDKMKADAQSAAGK